MLPATNLVAQSDRTDAYIRTEMQRQKIRLVHHRGGMPGFRADIARLVDAGLTVIVLMNLDDGDIDTIVRGVAALYLPAAASAAAARSTADVPPTTGRRSEVRSRSTVNSVPGAGHNVKSRSLEKIIKPMRLPAGTI